LFHPGANARISMHALRKSIAAFSGSISRALREAIVEQGKAGFRRLSAGRPIPVLLSRRCWLSSAGA
jgi:hypothetical protein